MTTFKVLFVTLMTVAYCHSLPTLYRRSETINAEDIASTDAELTDQESLSNTNQDVANERVQLGGAEDQQPNVDPETNKDFDLCKIIRDQIRNHANHQPDIADSNEEDSNLLPPIKIKTILKTFEGLMGTVLRAKFKDVQVTKKKDHAISNIIGDQPSSQTPHQPAKSDSKEDNAQLMPSSIRPPNKDQLDSVEKPMKAHSKNPYDKRELTDCYKKILESVGLMNSMLQAEIQDVHVTKVGV